MNTLVTTYLVYLAISLLLTFWVARVLFKHGGRFLVEAMGGEILVDSPVGAGATFRLRFPEAEEIKI